MVQDTNPRGCGAGGPSTFEDTATAAIIEEQTPLLGQQQDQVQDEVDQLRVQLRPKVTVLCFLLLVLLELGAGMAAPPTNEMMEKILCSQIHPESSRDSTLPWGQGGADDPCKNPDIQATLAMLRGWSYTFEAIPGLLCAVPYGILSDRWGRKPVLLLGVLGFSLAAGFNLVVCMTSVP
jgi:MFS family permease